MVIVSIPFFTASVNCFQCFKTEVVLSDGYVKINNIYKGDEWCKFGLVYFVRECVCVYVTLCVCCGGGKCWKGFL